MFEEGEAHRARVYGRRMLARCSIRARTVVFMAVLPAMAGCASLCRMVTSKAAPYDYFGKIELGAPTRAGRTTCIPLELSGGLWEENSGVGFKSTRVGRYEYELFVTIITCVGPPREKPCVRVQGLIPGQYVVFYLDPNGTTHCLGSVRVPSDENNSRGRTSL
jgi:hypothetical protein